MLCSVPLLRALRTAYPNAHIGLIASPVNYSIMLHHPYVNEVLCYDKKRFWKSPSAFFQFIGELRRRTYELTVVPVTVSVSVTSNVLAFASGARIRLGVDSLEGKTHKSSFLFNQTASLDWRKEPHRHQTLRNLDIAKSLGTKTEDLRMTLGITDGEKKDALAVLAKFQEKHSLLIGMHPGAGKIGNRWSAERFAEVANSLYEKYAVGIVVTAGSMDDDAIEEFLQHVQCPYFLLRNKPIRSVAALISLLSLFVSNDTGIMHVAAASGTKTLSLFGPTDPFQWAPIGGENRYIYANDSNINSITVAEVSDAARQMLNLS